METFKQIPGYEGLYEVSDLGNVKSIGRFIKSGSKSREKQVRWQNDKILVLSIGVNGYKVVNLRKDNKTKCIYVHRLIADSFIQKLLGDLQVDHINGDRTNNTLDNLRVISAQNNIRNSKKRKGNYTSEYKGVCFDKTRNKFKVEITIDGKCKSIGRFINEKDAALAYNNEALKIFGEFAKINII
jgi:hypothetical protein